MLNPKLKTPAFAGAPARRTSTLAGGASRRQAKLKTNSNVPAYRQAGKAQYSKPYDLENIRFNY